MGLQNLDEQVKAKLQNCKTIDDLNQVLQENSIDLTDEELNMVTGGLQEYSPDGILRSSNSDGILRSSN